MKKTISIAIAAILISGVAFSQEGKKCVKGKSCCDKKEAAKVSANKDARSTTSLKKA